LHRYSARRKLEELTNYQEAHVAISARNQLKGKVTEVVLGNVMGHVTVQVGENLIESVITKKSVEEMNLKKGDSVTVIVKATEVMLSK
jgi:molybdopterin-binding protein